MSEEITFNYCGFDSKDDLFLITNEINRNITADITENVQEIPGMVGQLFQGNSYGQKAVDLEVTIQADSERDRVQKFHALSTLIMQTGDDEYPMVFSDEAEYTYYGHFSAVSKPERISQTSHWAKFTLTFSCSDPKGYGEYESINLTSNPISLTPNGTAECYPIITCMPKKDVTKIAITDEDGHYIYLGAEVDPDTGDAPIDKEPLVLHDPCNTLATWTSIDKNNLTFDLENGVPGGTMQSTPNALRVGTTSDGKANFGNPVSGKWHGPVRQQWLPSSYSDYRIRIRLFNRQYYARSKGKCEFYLLNAIGERIGHISVKDNGNSEVVMIKVKLKNGNREKDIYNSPGKITQKKKTTKTIKVHNGTKKVKDNKGKTKTVQQWKTIVLDQDASTSTFTDFYGYIDLRKIGNKYRIEIMKFDDKGNPAWDKAIVLTWTDTKKEYTASLAGVAFFASKYDITEDTANPVQKYTENKMGLCDVKVWNIIDGGNGTISSPTIIARKGDEIKINCETRMVYKNGAHFMEKFYIGSQWPTMQGGVMKTFSFEPGLDTSDWYVEIRPTTQ